jgi:hypothetical protein
MSRRNGSDADVEAEDLLLEGRRCNVCEDVVLPFCGKVLIEDKVPVLQQSRVNVQEDGQVIVHADEVQFLRKFHLIVAHRRAVRSPGHGEPRCLVRCSLPAVVISRRACVLGSPPCKANDPGIDDAATWQEMPKSIRRRERVERVVPVSMSGFLLLLCLRFPTLPASSRVRSYARPSGG